MARHFVYVVACSDGSFYTGYTTDPVRRLLEHNSGKGSRYTRARRPVRLAYLEERRSRGEAMRRELELKRMTRSEKMLLCQKYKGTGAHSIRWERHTLHVL